MATVERELYQMRAVQLAIVRLTRRDALRYIPFPVCLFRFTIPEDAAW
jgi:hypothetical protein